MKPYHLCSKRHQRRRRYEADVLYRLCSAYGDSFGIMSKRAAELLGQKYEPVEFTITITGSDGSFRTYKEYV